MMILTLSTIIPALAAAAGLSILAELAKAKQAEKRAKLKPIPVHDHQSYH